MVLLIKQGMREITRLIHPSAQVPIKIGGVVTPYRVVDAVWGFFATYVATFALVLVALMATGLDQVSAFSATAACMNNLGPGLGEVANNYASIGTGAKWILSLAMLLGRLGDIHAVGDSDPKLLAELSTAQRLTGCRTGQPSQEHRHFLGGLYVSPALRHLDTLAVRVFGLLTTPDTSQRTRV